jgi:hypothetical protein
MKNTLCAIATGVITLVACNDQKSKVNETGSVKKDTVNAASITDTATKAGKETTSSMGSIVKGYLQIKNALANDNGTEAANGGNALMTAFKSFDESALTADKKKTFEDIKDDAGEHAEHIGKNGNNIKHQREHFEMLSKDIYDLVKTFGGGQPLYYDNCEMYNDNKGANWISETKEISNPYLGKKMPTCGTVKEELK